MTANDYNTSGIAGGKASCQNAKAFAHLTPELVRNPAYSIADRIFNKALHAKHEVNTKNPITWILEPKHIELRQIIVARLGAQFRLQAQAKGMNSITVTGVYAELA